MEMGIGRLGFNNIVFKRKFRWTFEVENVCGGTVPKHYVKLASRPNLTVEETEINHLNAKTWIPGKAAWETITVTYYDVATRDSANLFNWIATMYDFTDPVNLRQASQKGDYAGTGILTMYDGCGQPLEEWKLGDMWPQAVNFGDLDYSSSEECTIELTLRYSQVSYKSLCPEFVPSNCCSPCTGESQSAGNSGAVKFPDTRTNIS